MGDIRRCIELDRELNEMYPHRWMREEAEKRYERACREREKAQWKHFKENWRCIIAFRWKIFKYEVSDFFSIFRKK